MNKEIDFDKIEFQDPFIKYIENQDYVPLEDYSKFLTNYKLLRLDAKFLPFHITKGCLTERDINKLIDLLISKNKTLKYLNLSNCKNIKHLTIIKLKNFKNLVGLNLHNTLHFGRGVTLTPVVPGEAMEWDIFLHLLEMEFNIFTHLADIKLEYLDISNNNMINRPIPITHISSLEILSMENCKFIYNPDMPYSKLSNLRELDVSGNRLKIFDITEISKLKKLKLLYCNNIIFKSNSWMHDNFTWEQYFNFLIDNVIKIKTLEYLDISIENVPYDDYVLDKYNDLIFQKIQEMLNNLKKLKKLRSVFYSKYRPKELKINGVDVIVNEEIYYSLYNKYNLY